MKNMLNLLAVSSLLAFSPARAALDVGSPAPTFDAPAFMAGEALDFSLQSALQEGPVVLYFFPAAFTRGCNIEAAAFSRAVDDFAAHGARVIGITAGNIDQLEAFSQDTETCAGKFAVAADEGAKIAARYDALLETKPEWSDRTSYLIDRDGTIAAVYSDSNPNQHVLKMLEAASTLER